MAAPEGIVTALEVCPSITILFSPPENIRPCPATVFYGAIPSPNPNPPFPRAYTCCEDVLVALLHPHSMMEFLYSIETHIQWLSTTENSLPA